MDPIRQSSLQTPTIQLGSSDSSKLSQGVREPTQTQSLPIHYTQPLLTPVTSVDIQRQQSPPSLLGPRLDISRGSSCSIQKSLRVAPWLLGPRFKNFCENSRPRITPMHEMLQLSEQFKEMTTEPLRRTLSARTHGRKIMCSKYRHGNRLETIPEVEQNTTNESTNSVSGKTQVPLSSGSVRERRIADVRYRYGKLLPKSLLRNVGANDSIRRSSNEGFEFLQGVKEPRALQLQSMPFAQLLQTPETRVDIQRPPRQISPPLSGAWQQAVPWLLGPSLGISSDSARPRQNSLQEMRHITENYNNMTTEDNTMS